ncbi:DUF1345 domain-containing protein [Phormidesmis priestleyi]|uniref:DUF1345 domain-containing protein n=1 Tax=Phormidesmis priestleyi TaxID=268141 RepID=UPI00083A7337|nr:DUF1345 domain-containing protein [Phormidesmis priestleyi]
MNLTSGPRLSRKWSVRPRLLGSIAFAGLVALLLPTRLHWATRLLCLWDAGMLCFLAWTWGLMLSATPEIMHKNAQRQDAGRWVLLSLITAAACISILAIVFLLQNTKGASDSLVLLHVTLSGLTIVGSWLLVHTIFASHYARLYYQEGKTLAECKDDGLDFPGDTYPDYWDFLYFSFVIGMTSQVSDVAVRSRTLRRLSLLHGILSFFFNTSLLAMTINLVAGLI